MNDRLIREVAQSTDRHKILLMRCAPNELTDCVSYVAQQQISVINIGSELALFINGLTDHRHLNLEVHDQLLRLMESAKTALDGSRMPVLAIYNLGILMEPDLEINAVQVLKEFSKTSTLVIIWENQLTEPGKLSWAIHDQAMTIDFSDIRITRMRHEV